MTIDGALVERWIVTFGVPLAILAVLAIALWKGSKFLGSKLFDDNSGLVTRAVNTHVAFVNEVKDAVNEQREHAKMQSKHAQEQADHAREQKEMIRELKDALCESNGH